MKNQTDMKNTGTPPSQAFFMATINGWFKPALALLVLVLLGSGLLNAQVTVDATSSGFVTSGTTITVSHLTGSNINRLMLVGISFRGGGVVSTVTYGGDQLEIVGTVSGNNNAKTYIYQMINPPSGTDNVVVTVTGGDFGKGGIAGVMTFSGVDINTPLNSYASSSGNSTNPTLNNIPTATNELVFNVVALRQTDLTGVGTDQTSRWNVPSGSEMRGGGSTKPGPGATTSMSWTSASGDWSMSAVSIKPVPVIDLSITKSVNNSTPYIGQTITFTLNVTSSGTGSSVNTAVSDLLPSGYTFQSASPSTGTYNGGTGVWDIGTLNAGLSAVLTINAVVNASGSYANTATISGDVQDDNAGNNSASASITACQAGGTAPLFNN